MYSVYREIQHQTTVVLYSHILVDINDMLQFSPELMSRDHKRYWGSQSLQNYVAIFQDITD